MIEKQPIKEYNESAKKEGGVRMSFISVKEASEKWGVTTRWINYLCTAGRIPGAVKMGTVWLIPKGSEKPADRRRKNK